MTGTYSHKQFNHISPAGRYTALQRHNTANSKQIFPEKELCVLGPNFHIHVSVSDLYIPIIGLPILLPENMWAHECGNWDGGRAIPLLVIHKWDFRGSV